MRIVIVAISIIAIGTLLSGAATAQSLRATIDGAQEVPSTTSPGIGQACLTPINATSMLSYEITFAGLAGVETAAHIHGPAPAGQNAGVIFPLPLGSPKVGQVGPLNLIQLAEVAGGLWYINIHSTLFPGGEIRGQILTSGTPCTVPVEDATWGAIKALYDAR